MTDRTQEQLDLIYHALQEALKKRYSYYMLDNKYINEPLPSYVDWLKEELTFIDIQIKELQ